jgi:hypothetical protein
MNEWIDPPRECDGRRAKDGRTDGRVESIDADPTPFSRPTVPSRSHGTQIEIEMKIKSPADDSRGRAHAGPEADG